MIEIIYLAVFILISYAFGRRILMLFKFDFDSPLENFVFSITLAFGILAYLTFFLGLLGLLYKEVFYALFFVIFIFVFRDIKQILLFVFKKLKNVKPKINVNILTLMSAFFLFLVFMNLLASLAPPFGIDVLAYHLAVPKLYAQANAIHYIPHISQSNFPFMIDMLYLIALIVKNSILAKLVAYSLSVLLALSAYTFSARFFNKKVAVISAFIVYTMPMIIEYATQAYIDIGFTFFSFMAFYSFLVWSRKLEKKWIALSALMLAFSVSTKLIGISNVVILSFFVLYTLLTKISTKGIQKKQAISTLFLFGAIVLLAGSPWYVKSYLYTGNPVFPYFYNIFGGRNWDILTDTLFKNLLAPAYTQTGIVNFLLLPWNITIHSLEFRAFLGFGPMFLAFIPLYIFTKKNRVINQMLLFSFFYTVFWYFFIYSNLRYLSVYSLLAIVSAYVISFLLKKRAFRFSISILFVSFIVFSSAIWYGTNFKQLPYAFGLESEQEFYNKLKYPSLYEPCNFVNKIPNSKTLIFTELGDAYFCDNYIRGDIRTSNAFMGYSKYENADDLRQALKLLNITHIIFEDSQTHVDSQEYWKSWNMMKDLLPKHTLKIYEKRGIAVHELN